MKRERHDPAEWTGRVDPAVEEAAQNYLKAVRRYVLFFQAATGGTD